jgi:hypothetical protein
MEMVSAWDLSSCSTSGGLSGTAELHVVNSTQGRYAYFMLRSNIFLYTKKRLGKCRKVDFNPVFSTCYIRRSHSKIKLASKLVV